MTVEPRKRPAQARSAATFEAVVEAAAHILEKDGLAAFNTNQVAHRAGVSIGSLYQYFPGKDSILAEVTRRRRAELLNGLKAAVAGSENRPFEETVRKLVEVKIALSLRGFNLARAVDYAISALPLRHESEDLLESVHDLVAEFLGAHNIADPHEAARDVVAIAHGMIVDAAHGGESNRDAVAERTCRAIHGYLAACERTSG